MCNFDHFLKFLHPKIDFVIGKLSVVEMRVALKLYQILGFPFVDL